MTSSRTVVCVCCGQLGVLFGRGLRRACYARHRRGGTLGQFPVDQDAQLRARREAAVKAGQAKSERSAGLIEDYAFLRETGESKEMAAVRVGVTVETARKYERLLRVAAGEIPPPAYDREPRSVRLVRVRALVIEHIHRWPGVLFSVTSLAQSLSSQLDCSARTNWYDIRAVMEGLVAECLVEVVPGRWSYSPEGAARARRFRLASTSSRPCPPQRMDVAS